MPIKFASHIFAVLFSLFFLGLEQTDAAESGLESTAINPIPAETLALPGEKGDGSFGLDGNGKAQWLKLEDGLDFGEFRLNGNETKITVLRINPQKFDFVLGASSLDDKGPRTLEQWANELELTAAINASMYLPDNKTSTGYMRSGEHVNQGKLMDRFGAFFVAKPQKAGLPGAMIIDKDEAAWRELLDDFEIVVQNYRMTNGKRRILWSPGGPLYSISAVAQDGSGNILFLHSRIPVEAYSFVQHLLHLPLDVRTIMYVEGGAQAGLLVNSPHLKRELGLPHAPSLLITGKLKTALPNIIGVKRKPVPEPAAETNVLTRE